MSPQELKEWLVLVDENADGDVQFVEFVKSAIQLEFDPEAITQRLERIATHYKKVNEIFHSNEEEDRRPAGVHACGTRRSLYRTCTCLCPTYQLLCRAS